VVSVLPRALTASTSAEITDASGQKVTENPVQARCGRDSLDYLSGKLSGQHRFPDWSRAFGNLAAVGPTARQKAAGQSWVACVITPVNGAGATPYQGSLKNILAVGKLPSGFATCAESVEGLDTQAWGWNSPCDSNHQVEIFGVTILTSESKQSQLNHDCTALVRLTTRMADPSAGGQLAVRAVVIHTDPTTGAIAPGLGSNGAATCIVQSFGQRELKGSLVGVDAGPVPWA